MKKQTSTKSLKVADFLKMLPMYTPVLIKSNKTDFEIYKGYSHMVIPHFESDLKDYKVIIVSPRLHFNNTDCESTSAILIIWIEK